MQILDLVGLLMVCITAIVCTGILAAPHVTKDEDKKD